MTQEKQPEGDVDPMGIKQIAFKNEFWLERQIESWVPDEEFISESSQLWSRNTSVPD